MTSPKALIVGTGRSGTGWLSKVLNDIGLNCGHEEWFGFSPRRNDLDIEVSWLGTFEPFDGPVFAQLRHPMKSCPSLELHAWIGRWGTERSRYMNISGDTRLDTIRLWNVYTEQSMRRSERWWRVEDVTVEDIRTIIESAGHSAPDNIIHQAITSVPSSINSRGKTEEWSWDELPDTPEVEAMISLSKRVGYL